MGSVYFSDFNLLHKILGITKLVSIEVEQEYEERIHFNKPYSYINVKFGNTAEVLPNLPWSDWKNKSIVWLDYTEKIMEYMLGDIDIVMLKAQPGSILLLSINIEQEEQKNRENQGDKLSAKDFRLKKLEENIGRKNIPQRAYDMNLNVEKNKLIIREIIHNTILNALKKRIDGVEDKKQIQYKQLFNLYYKDSADMLTVGGIIYNQKQEKRIDTMFKNLAFIGTNENCFDIIVPKLTYREIHALDKLLPDEKTRKTGVAKDGDKIIPLSKNDVKNYANIYRYFPTFAETNL